MNSQPLPNGGETPHVPNSYMHIQVEGIDGLVGPPRKNLEEAVAVYAFEIVSEASNLETASRANFSTEVQYTSSHVEQAIKYVRARGHVPRRKKWYSASRIAAPFLFTIGGIVAPFGNAWLGWAYIGTAGIVFAAALSIYVEYNGRVES